MTKKSPCQDAPNFCEISTVNLSHVVTIKSKEEVSQNFVAFSKYIWYMIFTWQQGTFWTSILWKINIGSTYGKRIVRNGPIMAVYPHNLLEILLRFTDLNKSPFNKQILPDLKEEDGRSLVWFCNNTKRHICL